MRVAITGGTGTVGKRLTRQLSEHGHEVAVLTRDPEGKPALPDQAAYVAADLAVPSTLGSALEGADAVYLLTPLHPDEAKLGKDAVAATADAGVGRVVFQSVLRAEEAAHIPHFGTKAEIAADLRSSGLAWTILEPASFYQNDLAMRGALTRAGVYPQPIGPIGVNHVDCDDIADAALRCLTGDGHAGETYPLVGPEAHTGEEIAAIWSAALDRPIAYVGDDLEAWAANVREHLPAWLIEDLLLMWEYFIDHGLLAREDEVDRVRTLLGREPRGYESWVREVAAAWG